MDAYSLLPGNAGEQNDGTQAFTQAELGNVHSNAVTWARLPKELQPTSFTKYRDPVVIVKKALYGHPEAQGHWDMHLEAILINKLGYQKFENWPSLYWHEKQRLLLLVFVDEFKLAGPNKNCHRRGRR